MFIIDVVHAFDSHKVNYAICGGFAVALHGIARGTIDLDVVLRINLKNFQSAEKALSSLGLISRVPIKASEVIEFRKEYIAKRNLIAWSFVDPKNPAHVVDIILTEDLAELHSVPKEVFGTKIRVLAAEDLIEMKLKSGREQDLEDVKALRELLK